MKQPRLVLLFGMPRSGTTWIGKLFDSHKDTYYLHEPDSVDPELSIPLLVGKGSKFSVNLKQRVKHWLSVDEEKVVASRPFFKKSYISVLQWWVFLTSAYACKITGRLKIPFLNKPIRKHSSAPVIVWKSIESTGRLPALMELDNVFSIHILRHPCGQIASTMRGETMRQFDGTITSSEDWDLFQKLLEQSDESRFTLEDIKAMMPEERLALRWGIINDFGLNAAEHQNSEILVYEDLCRDPSNKLLALFDRVGLSLSLETQNYLLESTNSEDSAYYATKKKPLVSAYKWREELSLEQQQRIATVVGQFKSGQYYINDF